MLTANDVYLMKPEDVDAFSKSMALAFKDYPLFRYLVECHTTMIPQKQYCRLPSRQ